MLRALRAVELVNSLPIALNGQLHSLRTNECKNGQPVDSNIISFRDKLQATRHAMKSICEHNSAARKVNIMVEFPFL